MPTLFYETATRTIEKRKVQNIATYLKARFKIKWVLSLFTPSGMRFPAGGWGWVKNKHIIIKIAFKELLLWVA